VVYRRFSIRLRVERFGPRRERALEQRADLGCEPGAQHIHAVLIRVEMEVTRAVPLAFRELLLQPIDASPGADHALHMRCRAVPCQLEQLALILLGRDPRNSAYDSIRQLASTERVAQLWQMLQRAGNTHLLARRTQVDPRAPAQPVRTAPKAAAPAATSIKLGEHHE
jgi:hypothetical protein